MPEKCPLCGSRLTRGVCADCGYTLPDEASIASPYNYDPDDDRFGAAEEKYDTAAQKEIYPQRDAPVQYDEPRQQAPKIMVTPKNNPPANPPQQNNAPQQNNTYQNPYANFSPMNNQHVYNKTYSTKSGGDPTLGGLIDITFTVLVLATLFMPPAGVLGIINYIRNYAKSKDTKDLIRMAIMFPALFFGILIRLILA